MNFEKELTLYYKIHEFIKVENNFNSFPLNGLCRGYYEDDTRLFKGNYGIIHALIDAARYFP